MVFAFKDYLPLKLLNIQYLQERINIEIIIGDKKCNFISLCRWPTQPNGNFESFADKPELNLDVIVSTNPYLVVLLSDLAPNEHIQNW